MSSSSHFFSKTTIIYIRPFTTDVIFQLPIKIPNHTIYSPRSTSDGNNKQPKPMTAHDEIPFAFDQLPIMTSNPMYILSAGVSCGNPQSNYPFHVCTPDLGMDGSCENCPIAFIPFADLIRFMFCAQA